MLPTPRWRPTARLLVVDPLDRVLLFRFQNDRGGLTWLTPGGGIHRGESVEVAAGLLANGVPARPVRLTWRSVPG